MQTAESRSSVRDGVLSRLLAPLAPQAFIERYWGNRPLYLSGPAEKFEGLMDARGFRACARKLRTLRAGITDAGRTRMVRVQPIVADEIDRFLEEGATVFGSGLERVDRRLAALAAPVKRALAFPGRATFLGVLSRGASGFAVHFDACATATLQIEGAKRWRFSPRPVLAFPPANAVAPPEEGARYSRDSGVKLREWSRLESPDASAFEEVVLEPGDLLYLPGGTWHTTEAVGHSFALNLAFTHLEGGTTFDILFSALRAMLEHDPAWRGTPPPHHGNGEGSGVPVPPRRFLQQRLAELRAALDRIESDGSLEQAWQQCFPESRTSESLVIDPRLFNGLNDRARRESGLEERSCVGAGPSHV